MTKKLVGLLALALALSTSSVSASAAALQCGSIHRFSSRLKILSQLKTETRDLIPFEDIYSHHLAAQYAQQGLYIRRPTAKEIETVLSHGQFPDTPQVRSSLFVVQKGFMDYRKPGQILLAQGQKTQKKWNEEIDFERTEKQMVKQLESGEIVNEITLGQYKNALSNLEGTATDVGGNKADSIFLITLKDGTRGVFKAMNVQQAVAEVAAYKFGRALGLKLVPPTVIAKHKGKIGSFQFFIENSATGLNKQHGLNRDQKISKEDLANMELFYIMSGNWDAHPGNRVIDLRGGLGLIDNEAITRPQFYRYGELPWFALVQKGKADKTEIVAPESDAFPFEKAKYFNKPTIEDLQSTMKNPTAYDLELLKSKLLWYQQDSGKIGVIDWQNTLWLQLNIPEYYQARIPEFFPADTMSAASRLTMRDLEAIFQEPFVTIGGQNIFKRADLKRIQSRIQEVVRVWKDQTAVLENKSKKLERQALTID